MKKRIIFASLVAATMIANVTAKAETVSKIKADNNNLKSTNDYNKLLVNGQEKDLVNFINNQAPELTKQKEIVLVNKVLDLYNNNSAAFFNLNQKEKSEFNEASLVFIKNLEKIRTIEAANWLIKVKYTTNTINFLWNINSTLEVLDQNQNTDVDAAVVAI
jgi:hypothetical protein